MIIIILIWSLLSFYRAYKHVISKDTSPTSGVSFPALVTPLCVTNGIYYNNVILKYCNNKATLFYFLFFLALSPCLVRSWALLSWPSVTGLVVITIHVLSLIPLLVFPYFVIYLLILRSLSKSTLRLSRHDNAYLLAVVLPGRKVSPVTIITAAA